MRKKREREGDYDNTETTAVGLWRAAVSTEGDEDWARTGSVGVVVSPPPQHRRLPKRAQRGAGRAGRGKRSHMEM